jgi:hypothetical protein
MNPLRAILALGLAGLTAGGATGRGYLPAAGPVPLRFAAPFAARSQAVLAPLRMVTPSPVDPMATNASAATEGWPPGAGSATNRPVVFGSPSVSAAAPNPYDEGLVPPIDSGSWPGLYFSATNGPGMLSMPVAAPVTFMPPVPAPQSRATYTTTP